MKNVLINESPYLAKIVKRHTPRYGMDETISTGGFLFSYTEENGKIVSFPKNGALVERLSKMSDARIFVSSDQDPAGDLIAYEIACLVDPEKNEVVRVEVPFESFMRFPMTPEYLSEVSSRTFNVGRAERYLYERFHPGYSENERKKLLIEMMSAKFIHMERE